MTLTRSQKKYLKKKLKQLSLTEIASNLDVSEKEILKFLKSHWRAEKYQKFLAKERSLPKKSFRLKINWKVFAFLAFLVLAVYLNSLGNSFVSDDVPEILENENLGSFLYALSRPPGFIRPLLYFIAYKIGGLNPLFYRLINIFFHLGSVCLAYALISLIARPPLAFFTAGIFAVHPILTESVTWISGGGYAQYSFFFLLSFLAYILSGEKREFYPVSILAFFLSLCSSEKATVLPLAFLLFEVSFGNLKKNWKKLIPFFALSGILGLFSLRELGRRATVLETVHYQEPGINNPLIQVPIAITNYLELIFWPKNLTLYHSEMTFSPEEYFLRLGGFVLFLAVIFYFYKKNRQIFFWLLFFFISLLPTLTPFRVSWVVAERYVYLGALGVIFFAASLIEKIGQISKNQKIAYLFFAIILLAFSARTMARNTNWKNEDTLWLATAKTSPSSPQNHNNLGDLYYRRGEFEKAVEEFKTAIKLKPNYGDAYHNLANTYHELGRDDLAIENYQKALSFNPNIWQSYQNLAAIYFEQENFALAEKNLKKAININPENADLHTNLGIVYLELEEKEKAKEEFQKALQLDPQNQRAKQQLLTLP